MGPVGLAKRGMALCAGLALAALLWAPGAGADVSFCPQGEGAGQCGASIGGQRGLAVDEEEGLLYVADESNNRVDVFEIDEVGGQMDFLFAFGFGVADGATNAPQVCTTTCFKGIAGEAFGQFNQPNAIAVDNDPASSSQHAVYVGDSKNFRVQKFEPDGGFLWTVGGFASAPLVATGPGGVLYVVDNFRLPGDIIRQQLQRYEASGAPIPPQATLLEAHVAFARAIAVDSAGDLWVASQEAGLAKHCAPSWALCAGPFEAGVNFARSSLAIEGGELFVGQLEVRDNVPDFFNAISVLDPAGNMVRRFAYSDYNGGNDPINGLTAHTSALGQIFYSRPEEGLSYTSEPPPGPVAAAPSLEVKELGSTRATPSAEANPEGKASEAHFEYLTQAEYEAQGNSFAGPGTESTTSKPLGAEGFNLKATEADIGCDEPLSEVGHPGETAFEAGECLAPATSYRWRVVAENADGEGLGAVEGAPFTTKRAPERGELWTTQVGTDTAKLHAEVNPTGFPTTGFFEYVTEASCRADEAAAGGDPSHCFDHATQAPAAGQAPLDFGSGEGQVARQVAIYPLQPGTAYLYRLVVDSPLIEPQAGEAEELWTFAAARPEGPCANEGARIGAGAFLADCRAYELVSPLEKEGGDIRVLPTTVAQPAVLEQAAPSGGRLAYGSVRSFGGAVAAPYTSQYVAQRVAGREWETHPINPPRGRPIFAAVDQLDTEFKAFSADLCEAWIVSLAEPPLEPAALAGYSNLYRRTDELCSASGAARYEALAPLEEPASFPPGPELSLTLFGLSADGRHAALLSDDKLTAQGSVGKVQLYESVRGAGLRFACVLPEGKAAGSCASGSTAGEEPGAQSGRVSEDGERIFWSTPASGEGKLYARIGGTKTVAVSEEGEAESGTSGSWFWGASGDGKTAIYSTGNENADLYEFDVDTEQTEPIAKGVVGVMGISADAKRVYFASREALSGEANSDGEKAQAGGLNLYLRDAGGAMRFIGTLADADKTQAVSREAFRKRSAVVAPDGGAAAFVSVAPLTGYDNKDADGGTAREEVYRYDAEARSLSCVSCNPSGARPAGRSQIPFWETGMHAARVLSDDGSRVYFESEDSLAGRDTNGRTDVYQWEEEGAGGCGAAEASFSPASGGCVDLISSGQSPIDSRFVEASAGGGDVFFATGESLLPQDYGLVDIYDARVQGGLPIPPPPRPPCEGDACHAAITVPAEPSTASSAYAAPPTKGAKGRCAKGKRQVRRKGHVRCVPRHRAHAHKHGQRGAGR